ncbi:MAG: hypothetical protein E6Q26_06610 [Acinetobacter sp.]|nr:MAG: hypothetical protein E6Q26_06610 [Acinetobacter sp.]
MNTTTQAVATFLCHYIFCYRKTPNLLYGINCGVSLQKNIGNFEYKKTFSRIFLSLFFYAFSHKYE